MSEAGCRPLLFSPESIAHPGGKCNSFSINRHFFVTNGPNFAQSGKNIASSAFSGKKRRRLGAAEYCVRRGGGAGSPGGDSLRRAAELNNPSVRLVPRLTPSRRRKENAASVRKRHAPCAVSKFASGKEPTGLFARKHLLTPQEGGTGRAGSPGFYSLSPVADIRRTTGQLPREGA